ncbi:hypothetical protein [Maridesulfovibrio sp.]|uniref:hypothetical protein n=1 Tax=Maridesulfovibrio sp. TaxID=2795000 RepID=UPI0029C9E4F2|nr:hypothetical protein [Maridesulfovibrio sp.]
MSSFPILSVQQPWAGLIVLDFKDIENRTWKAGAKYHGKEILIHAGKRVDRSEVGKGCSVIANALRLVMQVFGHSVHPLWGQTPQEEFFRRVQGNEHVFECGGVLGSAVLGGCTFAHPSGWAVQHPKMVHWEFKQAKVLPFQAMPGRLGIFQGEYPIDVPDVSLSPTGETAVQCSLDKFMSV